ncbi:MAG TPA: 23S rRNA (pseudouridine(1915)-N(3))-methyltransferase RlmH [Candidatus Sulfopaludibacter sp.]|nr:23S rRNA (pseudouridine(1915)-N(3))-methyltransferase RlmH [Candidatus Sulfopaludibacter sp.]
MTFLLARIQPRSRSGASPADQLLQLYIERIRHTHPCEIKDFPDEAALAAHLQRSARRTRPALILTDSRGQALTSEQIAARLGGFLDAGHQQIVLAIGPPDGWTAPFLAQADLAVSFGRITLPHELATVILAEQTYRALAILAGHPYHRGH